MLKHFFARGIATSINGPANLLNNDPKIPPDILNVVPVLFLTAVFSFFSCVSDNLTFTLLYSAIYTNYWTFTVPFANASIVSFDRPRM